MRGVFLQPSLGGNGENERRASLSLMPARLLRGIRRSHQIAAPTAGISLFGAERLEQPVIAAAADDRAGVGARRVLRLEDEAGVIIEIAREARRESRAPTVDSARRDEAEARVEGVERGGEIEPGRCRERAQLRARPRRDRRKSPRNSSITRRFSALTPVARLQCRLFEKTFGDFARACGRRRKKCRRSPADPRRAPGASALPTFSSAASTPE